MTSQVKKPFHCSDCGKEFSKEKKLLSHFKVHSTGKSYKCEVCMLTFYEKSKYKKHAKLHFENGSCNCPKCGKVFVKRSWLKKHMRADTCDQPPRDVNKFVCRDCGKMYDSLAGIRGHLRKGKHFLPVFMCYACEGICSTSKALFIHILQHNDADLVIVGIDKEQRLEYFSTSKIRTKVDLSKLWANKTLPNTVERELPDLIDIDAYNALIEEDSDQIQQVENCPSQNTMQSTETFQLQKTMESAKVLPQSELALPKDTINLFPSASEEPYNNEPNNAILLQENTIPRSAMSPIESLKAIVPENNTSQNQQDKKNSTCALSSSSDDNLQQAIDLIPKKMPKLVSLYPEEEQLTDNNNSHEHSKIVLQNNIQMTKGVIYNGITTDPTTVTYTAPPPLVNTMFLPPLFLVQNNLPTNPAMGPQNTYLMGDNLADNLSLTEKNPGITIMDELTSMTNDIAIPRRKKKRKERTAKKYVGVFKKLEKDDSSNDATGGNSKSNEVQLLGETPPPHSLIPLTSPQNMISTITVQGQINSLQSECNGNSFINKNKDQKSRSEIWEILIDSDEDCVIVNNPTHKNEMHTNIKSKHEVNAVGHVSGTTTIQERNDQIMAKKSAAEKCKQYSPKDGVGVEDYITKFMWL